MNNGISFEDYLARHDTLTYTNVGVSMQPLLREGKDLFIVRKKGAERCRKGDVVLYKRASESYVLHRIIEVHPTEYVILGDNCILKEYGIRDKDILGIMTGFVRNGREHSTREPVYRMYSFLILHTIALRVFLKRFRIKAAKIVKRGLHEG